MKRFIDDASSSINPLSFGWPLAKRASPPRLIATWRSQAEVVTRSRYRWSELRTTDLDNFKHLPKYQDLRKSL
jgi:hypothetical protein